MTAPRSVNGLSLPSDAIAAAERVRPHVRRTPLDASPFFSEKTGANVYLKLENLQHTGSFKLRGAFNKLLSLTEAERRAGCIAASSGNHGAALAYAMSKLGVDGTIYVPETTSTAKVDAIRRSGVEVRFFGTDGLDTENHARAQAEEQDRLYLSPYNDAAVIAGQATCGVEIAEELPDIDAVFIAVGGGGLIAGAGGYLKSIKPDVAVVSCQPAASAVMTRSVEAGCILEMPSDPTLSDGTAGGIEKGAITFDLCRDTIDEYVLVSEPQIRDAMRAFIDSHHMLLEGAAGVALAGLLVAGDRYAGRNVAVVVCGGNISRETLRTVI
ncbi:MAG TPA: threonine/serine dehydratase [Woeseiaceae bacterium]|nr:threonine/serine dehydratase [Woeseiaceae bacterium]